ncbi:MAG: cbb3-type cytochrome oxidase assembly protein CcoS [Bdellovibrionaceae bacterium]|nr:cbb3-type cytochrome oxidase assembly protein CcoS [Pseudobdellovibrionaceae bacterium]
MNIILFMIPLALIFAGSFVAAFLWASSKGQFDDLETPALRILIDDKNNKLKNDESNEGSKRGVT